MLQQTLRSPSHLLMLASDWASYGATPDPLRADVVSWLSVFSDSPALGSMTLWLTSADLT